MQLRCRIIAGDSVTHHWAPELPYVQTWLPVINPRGMADWADADVAISSTVVPIKSSFFTFILLQKYTQHLLSGTPAFHDHAQVGVRSHAGATSNQSSMVAAHTVPPSGTACTAINNLRMPLAFIAVSHVAAVPSALSLAHLATQAFTLPKPSARQAP